MTGLKTPGIKFIKMWAQGFDFGRGGIVFLFDSAHHQTLYGHQYSNMRIEEFVIKFIINFTMSKTLKNYFQRPLVFLFLFDGAHHQTLCGHRTFDVIGVLLSSFLQNTKTCFNSFTLLLSFKSFDCYKHRAFNSLRLNLTFQVQN